ncbi:MAG: MFS transporter [Deltaproteobacteria bacterium]|nr:MFS transporter [Deltaproteobacteria bacterium]MBW2536653.1 MFS transporter [Deltaproteobacteria bacterium]
MLGRSFLLALAATFLLFMAVSAFVLMPRQLWELGASEREIGGIMGAMQLTTAVTMPLVGMLLHRTGSRSFMASGAILLAASCAWLAGLEQVSWHFYAARAAQGVAFAAFFVSAGTLVVNVVPEAQRAQGISYWGAGVLVTHAVAPLGGEWLVARGSFAELYWAAAACCAAAALVAGLLPPHRPETTTPSPLGRLLRKPAVATGLLALLTSSLGFGTIYAFLSAFSRREGLGPVAPFFLAYTLGSIAIRIVGGKLADRFDRRLVIVPALIACSAAIASLSIIDQGWHLALVGGAYGLASGLSYPALMAFVVDQADPADRPRAVALDNWSFTLGMLIAALGFGAAAESLGWRAAFGVVAAVGIAASFALIALGRPERKPAAS